MSIKNICMCLCAIFTPILIAISLLFSFFGSIKIAFGFLVLACFLQAMQLFTYRKIIATSRLAVILFILLSGGSIYAQDVGEIFFATNAFSCSQETCLISCRNPDLSNTNSIISTFSGCIPADGKATFMIISVKNGIATGQLTYNYTRWGMNCNCPFVFTNAKPMVICSGSEKREISFEELNGTNWIRQYSPRKNVYVFGSEEDKKINILSFSSSPQIYQTFGTNNFRLICIDQEPIISSNTNGGVKIWEIRFVPNNP